MDLINSEKLLYDEISALIEESRKKIYNHASGATVLLFWKIGQVINNDILNNKRADYGKQIVSMLSTQLNWAHIVEVLPLKTNEAKGAQNNIYETVYRA